MELIEQAVFTSAQTRRCDGYQVVAQSPGVTGEENSALAVWCPSHDSLIDDTIGASSVNFHPLPTGNYCLSKSSAAGAEYSGRRGPRVYTQCLIVPPGVLARFANNPFALLRACSAQGSLEVMDQFSDALAPLRLSGRATRFDDLLVARIAQSHDTGSLIGIVQSILAGETLGIPAAQRPEQLFEGILNCLPPECRIEVSFSTGLKISPRRPFRLLRLADDATHIRHVERRYGMSVHALDGARQGRQTPANGWAAYLHDIFQSQQFARMKMHMEQDSPGLCLDKLDDLGEELLPNLAHSHDDQHAQLDSGDAAGSVGPASAQRNEAQPTVTEAVANSPDVQSARRADAPHSRGRSLVQAGASLDSPGTTADRPSRTLGPTSPEVTKVLEALDDLVFDAIAGNRSAFEQLQVVWAETLRRLGPDVVAESREQYVRHALSVWRDSGERNELFDPAAAVALLDVICLIIEPD